jgi:hypothetical protein
MARYEHLPIYKQAMDVAVYFERVVAGFSRYHRYCQDQWWMRYDEKSSSKRPLMGWKPDTRRGGCDPIRWRSCRFLNRNKSTLVA